MKGKGTILDKILNSKFKNSNKEMIIKLENVAT